MKQIIVILLFASMAMSSIGASEQVVVQAQTDGSLIVDLFFPPVEVTNLKLYPSGSGPTGMNVDRVSMEGVRSLGHPGEPVLPVYPVTLLLPQWRELTRVDIISCERKKRSGRYVVEPGQPEFPFSMTGPFPVLGPKSSVYESRNPYPANLIENVMTQYCRGYRLCCFNLRPVVFNPREGMLTVCSHMRVRVVTRPAGKKSADIVPCRAIESDRKWVRRKVLNPEQVDTYQKEKLCGSTPLSGSRDDNPYVIVTAESFVAGFQLLAEHKTAHGIPGTIVTMEWIEENYGGYDRAEKLRNFIIDAYAHWNTQYVLLGGDDDRTDVGGESGDFIVPRRDFYCTVGTAEDEAIPADMYFACLDGTFNYDGDSRWAESTDGINGGEVDWFSEVAVGRACVDSEDEVHGFVNFLIAYENMDPDMSLYMKHAVMVGEWLWEGEESYGGDFKDEIMNGSSAHGYTTAGFPDDWTVDTLYDRDADWYAWDMVDLINSNSVHIFNHLGHSEPDYCMRITIDRLESEIHNSIGFFVYSQGCYCGSFDNRTTSGSTLPYDCVLEHHTTGEKGAFAFIGNSRYGWGSTISTDASSQYYDRQFFDAIFGEGIKELGPANQDSKEDNVGYLAFNANRWCGYELNLFGDPQTPLGGNASQTGEIRLDRTIYGNHVPMNITVKDRGLNADMNSVETVDVTAESASGDVEVVRLTETGANSSVFVGSIEVAAGGSEPGNRRLEAEDGMALTVHYVDADDGQGGSDIDKTASATVDFIPPSVAEVAVVQITDTQATITFSTSEIAKCRIEYGPEFPLDNISPWDPFGSNHSITINEMESCLYYFFAVVATDIGGNTTTDCASGLYYRFATGEKEILLNEPLDSDPGWTTDGDWAFGMPSGAGGSAGSPDPTSGFTGMNVYGYNLDGDYQPNMHETEYLMTAAVDCRNKSGTTLEFEGWLGVEKNNYDHASIQISTDGSGGWETIWENPSGSLDGGVWTCWSFDISEIADNAEQVFIRWGMGPTDSSVNYCGWNIDDIQIVSFQTCDPGPTPTPRPTFTPTATAPPSTATPTQTPTATGNIHIDLELTHDIYHAGLPFTLTCEISNPGPPVTLEEYILLDIHGIYFFWPEWSPEPDSRMTALDGYATNAETILDFIWPEGSFGEEIGLYFWAALLKPKTTTVIGNIDHVAFGYR